MMLNYHRNKNMLAKEWLRLLDASELEDERKNYLKFGDHRTR